MNNIQATRYETQTGGSKINYAVNDSCLNVQITVGGRATGIVTIRYRPFLGAHPTLGAAPIDEWHNVEFETPDDNTIDFGTQQNGVVKKTFKLQGVRISGLQIDDSGNVGDFWIHISQYD